MIVQFTHEFENASTEIGAQFEVLSKSELEDYSQNYNFAAPLINLEPISQLPSNIMPSGGIRYNAQIKILFLTKFKAENTKERYKDTLIDEMILLSQSYFRELNLNKSRLFINPQWTWQNDIIRQHTSNLLCGCMVTINIDTACNRL